MVPLDQVKVGDWLHVVPGDKVPVDGTVVEGRGMMDEAYLTGEPYLISKVVGSAVLSGAVWSRLRRKRHLVLRGERG